MCTTPLGRFGFPMPDLSDYLAWDATDIAELVRSGAVSDAEVRAMAAARHNQVNPAINAVVEWYADPTPVANLTGSLAGVPFLRKDYGSAEQGRLVEMGSRLAVGNRAPHTADFIRRLQNAGVQILGRTATPEFVQHGATESALNGITRNPWDLSVSPGGSSGGAAAAVAAGIVPVAHASDCAGSIRIPAAACGLVGLKPGLHRVLLDDGGWAGIATEFVLTRTVRDARAFLDVLGRGSYFEPKETYRIAWSAEHWAGAETESAVVDSVYRTVAALEARGHELVEVPPPVDYDELMSLFGPLFHRWVVHDIDDLVAAGRELTDDVLEPLTKAAVAELRMLTVADIETAERLRGRLTVDLARQLETHDMLLTPTLARSTISIGTVAGTVTDMARYIELNDEVFAYNWLFNVTGWPSLSIPAPPHTAIGVPLGVQLSAAPGSEHQLLGLAETLEGPAMMPVNP